MRIDLEALRGLLASGKRARAGRSRKSFAVEASATVPITPEETWDSFFGDQMQNLVRLSDSVVAVEDYQMRSDGTPRYRIVQKMGPLTMSFVSDYTVYERPYRTVNRVLDSPFGGTFYVLQKEAPGGTRVAHRLEVEPQNLLVGRLLPVLRPLLARSLQRDLDAFAVAVSKRSTALEGSEPGPVSKPGSGVG